MAWVVCTGAAGPACAPCRHLVSILLGLTWHVSGWMQVAYSLAFAGVCSQVLQNRAASLLRLCAG
jgi:hypothetical protein